MTGVVRMRVRAAAVSILVQAVGVFLASLLILVGASSAAATDTGRMLFSLVIAWCGVSFLAAFFARRRAERPGFAGSHRGPDPLLPVLALAGPLVFCLWTVLARAGSLGAWPLLAQVVFPLGAAALGYVMGRPGDDVPEPLWQQARRSTGSDVGAVSLEYIVVALALIGILGAALFSGTPGKALVYGIESLICKASGGDCDPVSPFDEDYKPPKCLTSSNTLEQKNEVKVAFVRLGSTLTMVTSHNSDGSVSVSLVSDGEIGAEAKAGLKGKLEVGDLNLSPALEASVGGALQGKASQTWDFASEEEAEKFRGELQTRYTEDVASQFNPFVGLVKTVRREIFADDLPDPTTVTVAGGGKVEAGAEAGANIIGGVKVGGEASTLLSIATIRNEDGTYDTESAVEVTFKGTASAEIFGAGMGGDKSGKGVIKVRRDADGNPVKVTWVGTATGTFQALFGQPRNLKDALDLKKVFKAGIEAGGKESAVVTTTLDLDTTAKQDAFRDWESSLGAGRTFGGSASLAWDSLFDDQSPAAGDGALADVLDDHGMTSIVTYEGDRFGLALGAEGNLGIGVGLEIGGSSTDLEAVDAVYLGAPDVDGSRELVPFEDCVA